KITAEFLNDARHRGLRQLHDKVQIMSGSRNAPVIARHGCGEAYQVRKGNIRFAFRWLVIRSAMRFVEPALKPFCEIADGRIPACWCCENVQVIRHRNRRQNSPLIELLEHSTAYIPHLSIGED